MSKKKTPQEKKQASYEKDHYTFAWNSPHGFRKTWKKKKNYLNRVVRRKGKALLHDAEAAELAGDDIGSNRESLTSEFFRKGLSKKRVRKTGVVNLREKIRTKKEFRESSFNLKERSRAGRAAGYRRLVTRVLDDKEYLEKSLSDLGRVAQSSHFQAFLHDEPIWLPKLEQWILSARKKIAWRQLKMKRATQRKPTCA